MLPVVMGGDFDAFWPASDRVARGGVRAGLFHPLTSYSLPDAVRFAELARRAMPRSTRGSAAATRDARAAPLAARRASTACSAGCCSAPPTRRERYRILERFYRLPEPLIGRFYAGRSTPRRPRAHPRRQAARADRPGGRAR